MDWITWYNGLVKPTWTPSPSTIGLIWQIIYPRQREPSPISEIVLHQASVASIG